jgi:hypothetical protein
MGISLSNLGNSIFNYILGKLSLPLPIEVSDGWITQKKLEPRWPSQEDNMWKRLLPAYRLRRKSENPSMDRLYIWLASWWGNGLLTKAMKSNTHTALVQTTTWLISILPITFVLLNPQRFHTFTIPKLLIILHLDVIINLVEFLYHIHAQH